MGFLRIRILRLGIWVWKREMENVVVLGEICNNIGFKYN